MKKRGVIRISQEVIHVIATASVVIAVCNRCGHDGN